MTHVQHAYPRAFEAATKVDPMILAAALDHIARTAAKSRSETRRLRWIEQRALCALRGDEYRDIDVDLPKSAGPDTREKLGRRLAAHAKALRQLLDACERMEAERDCEKPTEEEYQAAVANARALLERSSQTEGAPA
jgi:hypothetical protein